MIIIMRIRKNVNDNNDNDNNGNNSINNEHDVTIIATTSIVQQQCWSVESYLF